VNEYAGEWMETYTGGKFHFRDPKPEEIKIVDIAHHLSLLCRFTGACREFYSVAQHCCEVSKLVPDNLKLSALLHDASEAYINDISRPVKYSHKLDETEKVITDVIDKKYGTSSKHLLVKEADDILCATEARDLMANTKDWARLPQPLPWKIIPVSPEAAKALFLGKFLEYGGKE
jgi:hypothetical protein